MTKTIGIIGCGNMGSAIVERLKSRYQVYAFDKDKNKTKDISGAQIAKDNIDLVNKVDIVMLAVKPQDFDAVLDEIKSCAKDKLVVSIAAGITTGYIEERLGRVRAVRVMPNLPAKIGRGMICLCRGKSASDEDLSITEQLFKNLGETLVLNEDMMDAATAISGSGPGYLYDWAEGRTAQEIRQYAKDIFIPALADSAENIGFNPEQARILAENTAEGSIVFLEKTNLSSSQLKKQVASRGGTTQAGLEVLHRGGSLKEAVKAALMRAWELSKKVF